MNTQDIILQYFDGGLDESAEKSLFYDLASDPEMRQYFKKNMLFQSAIKNNSDYFAPSAESTMKIFGALGFSAAAAVAASASASAATVSTVSTASTVAASSTTATVASTSATSVASGVASATTGKVISAGIIGGIKSYLATNAVSFAAGLLLSITSAMSVYYVASNNAEKTIAENNLKSKKQIVRLEQLLDSKSKEEEIAKQEIAYVSSQLEEIKHDQSQVENNSTKTQIKYVYVNSNQSNNELLAQSSADTKEDILPSNSNDLIANKPIEANNLKSNTNNLDQLASLDQNKAVSIVPEQDKINSIIPKESENLSNFVLSNNTKSLLADIDLSVEYHATSTWNLPQETVYPANISKINNNAIAIFYGVGNNFKIGAEFRQETFYQEFNGIDANTDMRIYYKQQPNLSTFATNIRHNLNLASNLDMTNQISLGLNEAGQVYRTMSGLEYSPYKNISILLGVEYSYLSFTHQANNFASSKVGLNYGFAYKF